VSPSDARSRLLVTRGNAALVLAKLPQEGAEAPPIWEQLTVLDAELSMEQLMQRNRLGFFSACQHVLMKCEALKASYKKRERARANDRMQSQLAREQEADELLSKLWLRLERALEVRPGNSNPF
jgi:hypothetical protein